MNIDAFIQEAHAFLIFLTVTRKTTAQACRAKCYVREKLQANQYVKIMFLCPLLYMGLSLMNCEGK